MGCLFICQSKGPTCKLYMDNIMNLMKEFRNISTNNVGLEWKNLKLLHCLNLLLVPTLLLTVALFPPFYVVGFHWENPCKLSLNLYFLLDECLDNWELSSIHDSLEETNMFLTASFLTVTVNGTICILVVFGAWYLFILNQSI